MKNESTEKTVETNAVASIKNIVASPKAKSIFSELLPGLYSYAVVFFLGEILISGGMSEKSPYFLITIIIALIAFQIAIIRNSNYSSIRKATIAAGAYLIVFAVLDYLIINLFFEKNNYEFYKFWPNYFVYLAVILLPFIRSKWHSLSSFNPKSLLTKKG